MVEFLSNHEISGDIIFVSKLSWDATSKVKIIKNGKATNATIDSERKISKEIGRKIKMVTRKKTNSSPKGILVVEHRQRRVRAWERAHTYGSAGGMLRMRSVSKVEAQQSHEIRLVPLGLS